MNNGGARWNGWDLLYKLADIPQELANWVKAKSGTLLYESGQLDTMNGITIRQANVSALRVLLHQYYGNKPATLNAALSALTHDELNLLRRIRERTVYHNRNNLTRTQAYWHMYQRYPELHWAFLAHMVSRNGGWNMTDLKGELLPYLLDDARCHSVFAFLERANSLIFHDAYPQLLLYDASRQSGEPWFHLLAWTGVSRFMRPVWELFWARRDSALLTTALIINEQHYIQKRVVEHPFYHELVLDTVFFAMQSLLQLNQVVFPYKNSGTPRLAGLIIENFSDLNERIEAGKKLYAILFGIPVVHQGAVQFAGSHRHTGSRCDYWPELFAPIRKSPPVPRGKLMEWLDGCCLRPGVSPLYSPPLSAAWKDRAIAVAEPGDWYTADEGRWSKHMNSVEPPFAFEMTHEYCFGLNKIELAVLAGDLTT
jgi:hypothetical protein